MPSCGAPSVACPRPKDSLLPRVAPTAPIGSLGPCATRRPRACEAPCGGAWRRLAMGGDHAYAMGEGGFEPPKAEPDDLQSPSVDRLDTPPMAPVILGTWPSR